VSRVILHVDMDAFFASVEQRDEPAYRGQPLIVGSPPDQRGVVCAASYEARRFGVRSAMPSRTAAKLCPQGVFVRPRMEAYRTESAHVMAILREVSSAMEKMSVDEAYIDVTHRFEGLEADAALQAAVPLAREIKSRIAGERRLTASIGVAANRFLAKLGSDLQKPDGLTMIAESGKEAFLRPLPVNRIPGVGPVTAQSLEELGLLTIGSRPSALSPAACASSPSVATIARSISAMNARASAAKPPFWKTRPTVRRSARLCASWPPMSRRRSKRTASARSPSRSKSATAISRR